jgi:hypothetical protein
MHDQLNISVLQFFLFSFDFLDNFLNDLSVLWDTLMVIATFMSFHFWDIIIIYRIFRLHRDPQFDYSTIRDGEGVAAIK